MTISIQSLVHNDLHLLSVRSIRFGLTRKYFHTVIYEVWFIYYSQIFNHGVLPVLYVMHMCVILFNSRCIVKNYSLSCWRYSRLNTIQSTSDTSIVRILEYRLTKLSRRITLMKITKLLHHYVCSNETCLCKVFFITYITYISTWVKDIWQYIILHWNCVCVCMYV